LPISEKRKKFAPKIIIFEKAQSKVRKTTREGYHCPLVKKLG